MTYKEAVEFLYSLRLFGTKLGLENTFQLAEICGNPHLKLRFIHVAGTNGKGSCCAILESIYRHAGLRVGLFTSPHLVTYSERIQVNRQLMPEKVLIDYVEYFKELLKEHNGGEANPEKWHFRPTFFEVSTVIGLLHFVKEKCDLVIWETGMGGRLDATNIVQPMASVITNVQMDHSHWLGTTLTSIAFEKAGIIKPRRPIITGINPHLSPEDAEAFKVVQHAAEELDAPLHHALPDSHLLTYLEDCKFPLLGDHQVNNAAVALRTVEVLENEIPVPDEVIKQGLCAVRWAGRLHLLQLPDERKILLDGAHNLDGVKSLFSALEKFWPNEKPLMILGMLKDKDWSHMCNTLLTQAREVYLVPVQSERSAHLDDLEKSCSGLTPVKKFDDLKSALKAASEAPFVLIAGSLHLIGEAMELLGVTPVSDFNERGLNEWNASKQA